MDDERLHIRMSGLIENVANCAIWWLRGSLNENAGFSSLSQAFAG